MKLKVKPGSVPLYVTTTFPMMWCWNAPVEGKPRKGQPCRMVVTPAGTQRKTLAEGAGTIETVTVEFTDGTKVRAQRRAVRMRKWVRVPG